jgi:hypothetical protein
MTDYKVLKQDLLQNLINSKEQSPSWEANNHSAQEHPPPHLWNSIVPYPVHNGLSLAPILSQMNPSKSKALCVAFRDKLFLTVRSCWPPRQIPQLEDHPLSAVGASAY